MKRYGQPPTSAGPLKPKGKLKRKEDKKLKTAKQLADPDTAGKKWTRKLSKYRKTKEQIKEIESKAKPSAEVLLGAAPTYGPAKSGGPAAVKTITKETNGDSKRKKRRKAKVKREKQPVGGETFKEGKERRARNKAQRKKQRLSKTKEKIADAKAAGDKPIKTAKLQKRQKRQEGRAERKKIKEEAKAPKYNVHGHLRKKKFSKTVVREKADGTSGLEEVSKRTAIKRSRKDQKGPAKSVEKLKQKKKDMQLGKHRVGTDDVKKFNKKIKRINKRIERKS